MKIRKGDNVIMLNGKDKGKTGKVSKVLATEFPGRLKHGRESTPRKNNRVIVEGLNMLKRAVRARKQGQKGQIISKERSVDAASVALVCKSCGKPTRVGYKMEGETKVRICKKCKNQV